MQINLEDIKFDEKGLIPAIVQDHGSKDILMVAYMNKDSLKKTIEVREAVFWSRSRKEIWHKGATSGDYLKVNKIILDCDLDALVIMVEMIGEGACHNGTISCFIDPSTNVLRTLIN